MIEELVRRRKAARVTRTKLAVALKTDQSQVSKYERLERELGLIDFVRYCRAIKTDAAELIRIVERA